MDPIKVSDHMDGLKWYHCVIIILAAIGMGLASYRFGVFDIDTSPLFGVNEVSDFLAFWIGVFAYMAKWLLTPLLILCGVLYYIALAFMIGDKLSQEPREYKSIGGRLFVRHGAGGDWLEVDKHMREDHPET